MTENNSLAIFENKQIRKVWHNEEWWFSVIDIVDALDASSLPKRYWSDLKAKLSEEGFEPYDKIVQLKLPAEDGKLRDTDCANTEGAFRIIQSIPSPKAEPFKLWLAKVGYDRIKEIENPELAQDRMKLLYEQKGYSKSWIDKRLRGMAIRQDLTDEWKQRGVNSNEDFAILTAEISKAAFGMTPSEYKQLKGLYKENIRDHMTDLELIFNMLEEASTTEIEKTQNPKTFPEHKHISRKGGTIAKNARLELEKETKKAVISEENYLDAPEKEKRKRIS